MSQPLKLFALALLSAGVVAVGLGARSQATYDLFNEDGTVIERETTKSTQKTQTTLRITGLTAASCEQLKPGLTSTQVHKVLGVKGKPMVVGGGSQVLGKVSGGQYQGEFFWVGNGSLKVEYSNDRIVSVTCFLR